MKALILAVALAALFASSAQASPSPPWNPTLCQGVKWRECAMWPGSICTGGGIRHGEIYIRLDSCFESWGDNPEKKPRRIRAVARL